MNFKVICYIHIADKETGSNLDPRSFDYDQTFNSYDDAYADGNRRIEIYISKYNLEYEFSIKGRGVSLHY